MDDLNRPDPPVAGPTPRSSRRFEVALCEVEQIVARLETGQLDLSESLDQYQKGIETLKECHRLLESAERRITLLSGFDADGVPLTAPFDEAEMSLSEKQARRGRRRGATAADPAPAAPHHDPDDEPALF
jgi:exodeoxyribonuclease VII small subunit